MCIRDRLKIPPFKSTDASLKEAASIHKDYCQSCHLVSQTGVERPAYNLYEQAADMPESEFFARLLIGVRGDRVTGIDNPFSDAQLMSLLMLYSKSTR